MALLADVDKGISQETTTVAGRFKCAVRTVQSIKQNRKDIQKQADTKAKRLYSAGAYYIGENLYCAGARYSAGEVACTIPALYRDHYCTWYY